MSSPPGVGGVLHVTSSGRLSRPALPGRSAASLAYCVQQFDRRLTTKELVFQRFVAPPCSRVNRKKTPNSVLQPVAAKQHDRR